MRIVLSGLLCIGLFILFILADQSPPYVPPSRLPLKHTPTMSPTPLPQSVDVMHNEKLYRVAWLLIQDPTSLTLIPNFTQKHTTRSLTDNHDCTQVVNGGFYTTDHQPTGLFVAQGTTLHRAVPNTLLNGYFSIDQTGIPSILPSPPDGSFRLALQTGPVLMHQGLPVNLTIRDDEYARRVGVGITKEGLILFVVIYDPENTWSGPKLADMPSILAPLINRLGLTDAVNLDGGSASAFIRDDFSLQELTSVGSFFCIR